MESDPRVRRYRELQEFVGWTAEDATRVAGLAELVDPTIPGLVDEFFAVILAHEGTRLVLKGGSAQVDRLKRTLSIWVRQLVSGEYDEAYVLTRWRVGHRHVEIGLDQIYTNAALSRLRTGLFLGIQQRWRGTTDEFSAAIRSLGKLLDLDLAIIGDAYQSEYSKRLEDAGRLATLGQVAGGVAHELRNPLNVIRTSVFFLRNARRLTPAKVDEHMERIERHVARAEGVVSALASFARLPVAQLDPVSPATLVREALEVDPPGEGIELIVQVPDSLPQVLVDAGQVRIALGNLIRNALDAMPDGGRLSISGEYDGVSVTLRVADTGMGIASKDLARVMEPLFTTKAGGLGLGLSISKSILEKNRGSLSVESELGRGSVFLVRLTPDSRRVVDG